MEKGDPWDHPLLSYHANPKVLCVLQLRELVPFYTHLRDLTDPTYFVKWNLNGQKSIKIARHIRKMFWKMRVVGLTVYHAVECRRGTHARDIPFCLNCCSGGDHTTLHFVLLCSHWVGNLPALLLLLLDCRNCGTMTRGTWCTWHPLLLKLL